MKKKNLLLLWALLNTLSFLIMITVNALANILPLNGKMTGELSDSYPNLFVPAGLTFSIWGVIYLLLTAFIIFQIYRVLRKGGDTVFLERIGPFFFLSSLANSLWIFAWHWEHVFISVCLMLFLLYTLLVLYFRLEIGRKKVAGSLRYFVHLPVSVYLGWITVATVANITALLVNLGWNRFGLSEVFWTVLVMTVAVIITLIMVFRRFDIGYALVVLWAFLGIYLKRSSAAVPQELGVEAAALAGMGLIGLGLIFRALGLGKWKKSK